MKFRAFCHTPSTIRDVLSELYANQDFPVNNETYQVEYAHTIKHLACHFELPESTANYLLDQLIVEGYVKVKKEDKEFYVLVPMIK